MKIKIDKNGQADIESACAEQEERYEYSSLC